MNAKRLSALLLALVMICTAGACSSKKDEPAPLDPSVLSDAISAVVKDPSVENFGTLYGGTLFGGAYSAYLNTLFEMGVLDEDTYLSNITALAQELDGASVNTKDAKTLTADEIADYQKQLDAFAAEYKEMLAEAEKTAGSDSAMVDALKTMVDALDGVKISEGCRVTVKTGSGADAETQEICVFGADGKWFSDMLFE